MYWPVPLRASDAFGCNGDDAADARQTLEKHSGAMTPIAATNNAPDERTVAGIDRYDDACDAESHVWDTSAQRPPFLPLNRPRAGSAPW